MKGVRWDPVKNEMLKATRGVSFEELLAAELIGILRHPAKIHQNLMLFDHQGYVWVVPCVEDEKGLFLKTLYPSRRYTKSYKKDEPDETH